MKDKMTVEKAVELCLEGKSFILPRADAPKPIGGYLVGVKGYSVTLGEFAVRKGMIEETLFHLHVATKDKFESDFNHFILGFPTKDGYKIALADLAVSKSEAIVEGVVRGGVCVWNVFLEENVLKNS